MSVSVGLQAESQQAPQNYIEWLTDQPCILTGSVGFNELIPIQYSCHNVCYSVPLASNAYDHFKTDGPLITLQRYYDHGCLTEESAKMWFYCQAVQLFDRYVSID